MSKLFAIAIPHEQAMDVKDEVSFFQAVKVRLAEFDAAGIKKPDISILSEEFLKKNLVKSKSLMEMLENSIKRYHNKILRATEVMDELIKLSKEWIVKQKKWA